MVEVTTRTLQGRMLLKPGPALNQTFLGVLGRAQRRYEIDLHALIVMSNHYHLLVSPRDSKQLSDFMGFVNANLSKEVEKIYGWKGPMWDRRYGLIPVSQEEGAQVERLKYILSHGCKENLVMTPEDWPGVHSVDALVRGQPLRGRWVDRSRIHKEPRRESLDLEKFTVEEHVELTPIPVWNHLPVEAYRSQVSELVAEITQSTRDRHRRQGTRPLGAASVLEADPEMKSGQLKRRPKPLFHAVSRKVRQEMTEQFRAWLLAYRDASEAWRRGDFTARFPWGSFPPSPRWVGLDDFDPG